MITNLLGSHLNYCPEALLMLGIVIVILVDLFLPGGLRRAGTFYLCETLLIGLGVFIVKNASLPSMSLFAGHYIFDSFAVGFKLVLVVLCFLVFAYAKHEASFGERSSEFCILSLLSLLGAMVLVSALSLLSLYLGLELLSLPLYALVALKRDSGLATEGAMKYFVMGALASAFLLFGFSLLYGLTGSIFLPVIAIQLMALSINPLLFAALALIIVAVAFKLGIFPFHMWVPDVYQGTSLSVVSLLASVAKLGAFALLFRVLFEACVIQQVMVQQLLIVLGIMSLVVGNVVALVQKNIRRMLGYSTVANMGLVFMAFALGSTNGFSSSAFYLISYAFMSLALFGLLMVLLPHIENVDELRGLHAQHPFVALLFLLVMLSFVGLPPLLGFDAKLMVIMALVNAGHLGLSIFVVVMSVVGAAYYLRILKDIYFEPALSKSSVAKPSGLAFVLSGVNALALLVAGILPSMLMVLVTRFF